jgi:hypothetical protein
MDLVVLRRHSRLVLLGGAARQLLLAMRWVTRTRGLELLGGGVEPARPEGRDRRPVSITSKTAPPLRPRMRTTIWECAWDYWERSLEPAH